MTISAASRYRTFRGDNVIKLEYREYGYGPHGPTDSHPWLATLVSRDGATFQQWYTRDGMWSAGKYSTLLDLVRIPT